MHGTFCLETGRSCRRSFVSLFSSVCVCLAVYCTYSDTERSDVNFAARLDQASTD